VDILASTIPHTHGWEGFVKTQVSSVNDAWKESVSNVSEALIELHGKHPDAANVQDAGWLPTKRFAKAWLAFEQQPQHQILPLE